MKPGAKVKQVVMGYRDVATALVRDQGIHEGHWRLYLHFGNVAGVNANVNGVMMPAAFVPVLRVGLMRDEQPNDLTVDAAVVNPRAVELVN